MCRAAAGVDGDLQLARSAAEVSLPNVRFGRVLAVGGTGNLRIGTEAITLRDLALGRLSADGALEARAYFDDHGIPRALGAELVPPHDGSGPLHIAFAVSAEELAAWEQRLAAHGVEIEGRTKWRRGGESIYFRDPDGHLLELATPGLWTVY